MSVKPNPEDEKETPTTALDQEDISILKTYVGLLDALFAS